jgi:subtilase family serine protease
MILAFLLVASIFGGATFASAQFVTPFSGAQTIEFSNGVFHIRACGGPQIAGYARCHAHIVTDRSGNIITRAASKAVTPSGYAPSDLRSAYRVTGSGSSSTVIAIVDAYGYTNAEANLDVYRAQYGLPACTSANGCFAKYNERGIESAYPAQNLGWEQETSLDLAMASAMCPNCKIVLIEANSDSYNDLATAENLAASLHAHVISNSYGGAESGTQSIESAYNHAGIAITASTGDSGYSAGPQFPATSPHVTAVGGTSLYRASNSRGWSETAWSDGGSGCSKVYGKPTWQHDPLCTMRMEADVSAIADPSTGVAVYGPVSNSSVGWMVFGGTSVAAPLIAGLYGVNGGSVSYGSNPYGDVAGLNDITTGNNGKCGGTYFCTAGPGYDGPTGLGTPAGSAPF